MSHHQLFYYFCDGYAETFPVGPIIQILERHGFELHRIDDGHFDVRSPSDIRVDHDIGEDAGLFLENGQALEFGITRPYYTDRFFSLAANLICDLGLCMCSDAPTGTYVREEAQLQHIPGSIGPTPTVIRSAEELKTANMKDDPSVEGD